MAFKLLSNVIASGTQIQHMAGEIVDIPDAVTANSLIRRGLAETVIAPATHVWGEGSDDIRGGKSVAQKQAEDASLQAIATQTAQPTTPAPAPVTPAAQTMPAPTQTTTTPAPQADQPSAVDVTATAESVK